MSYSLEHVHDEAAQYASFLIDRITEASTVEDIGRMANDLAELYQTLGLCELLIEANTEGFFHRLIDGALTRRYFLRRCLAEDRVHPERRASVTGPLVGAIVAGQYGVARELDDLVADAPVEGHEYDEDYYYARLVGALVREEASDAERIFGQYVEALGELSEARVPVMRALLDRDRFAFHQAFLGLLIQYEAEMEYRQSVSYRYDDHHLVFLEGLALLRIAEDSGITAGDVYRYCPTMARKPDYARFEARAFPYTPLDA
ncbi:MAG: hypothetical protein AAGI91_10390 [Bacteroidota bacterium]